MAAAVEWAEAQAPADVASLLDDVYDEATARSHPALARDREARAA